IAANSVRDRDQALPLPLGIGCDAERIRDRRDDVDRLGGLGHLAGGEQRGVVDEQRDVEQRLALAAAVTNATILPLLVALGGRDHEQRLVPDVPALQLLDELAEQLVLVAHVGIVERADVGLLLLRQVLAIRAVRAVVAVLGRESALVAAIVFVEPRLLG